MESAYRRSPAPPEHDARGAFPHLLDPGPHHDATSQRTDDMTVKEDDMQSETRERQGAREPERFRRTPKKAAASGWVGSALEYYDWFIYAQAAALVFPTVFFPGGNPTVALIASLGTYAVGYVARPIGAAVLGHWGDRHGRKNVLTVAMIMMGVATFGVGLLPT